MSTYPSTWGRSSKTIGWGLALLILGGILLGVGQYQAAVSVPSLYGASNAGLALVVLGGIVGLAGGILLALGLYVLASNVDMLAADTARRLEAEAAAANAARFTDRA